MKQNVLIKMIIFNFEKKNQKSIHIPFLICNIFIIYYCYY